MISISMFTAAPFRIEPNKKTKPPINMDIFRPNLLVTIEAKKEATNAAM